MESDATHPRSEDFALKTRIFGTMHSSFANNYRYTQLGEPVCRAQSASLATYLHTTEAGELDGALVTLATYTLSERHIYGSSRLGMETTPVELLALPPATASASATYSSDADRRLYELTNHLGNVLATFTARKLPIETDGAITGFIAHVTSMTDYYPFGSALTGRMVESGYRYGFNGKEIDNEIKGNGNQQDYGFRIYDLRLGRFLSVDPLTYDYPELTPFQFASNTPIWAIDIDGLEAGYVISYNVQIDKNGDYVTEKMHEPTLTTTSGNWSGVKIESQFFHNNEYYGNNQGNIPGWRAWRIAKQEEFNKGAAAFGMGLAAVLLAVPSGGGSLYLAAGFGGSSMALGSFKMYQVDQGRVRKFENLPLGLGEMAGGFIGAQFGHEELGQKIGGFGEALISGHRAIKDLPTALMNKDALNVARGMLGLYEAGSSGYEAYESIINEIECVIE